mgnify:CR=1 FL=1
MCQYIMKTNVKRLELFKYGLGAISSLHNYYYYYYPEAAFLFLANMSSVINLVYEEEYKDLAEL